MSLLCSTCSTRPRKNCKKSTKNSKFQKKIFKKTKKSFKKLFFSIFPKWHYFNFAISILVFVAIKMHLLKRYLRRYLYFIFIQKLFQWCIPCRQRVFIGYRLFKLMIDQSELTFNDAILHLKSRKPPFFLILPFFCEISNEKKLIKQKYSFWTCGIHLQMSFWNVEISQSLFFYILLSCQMSHMVWPRLDLTVWLTAVWLFDSHFNRSHPSCGWCKFTWPQQWTLEWDLFQVYFFTLNSWPLSLSNSHLTSKSLVTCSKWQFRGSPGH